MQRRLPPQPRVARWQRSFSRCRRSRACYEYVPLDHRRAAVRREHALADHAIRGASSLSDRFGPGLAEIRGTRRVGCRPTATSSTSFACRTSMARARCGAGDTSAAVARFVGTVKGRSVLALAHDGLPPSPRPWRRARCILGTRSLSGGLQRSPDEPDTPKPDQPIKHSAFLWASSTTKPSSASTAGGLLQI